MNSLPLSWTVSPCKHINSQIICNQEISWYAIHNIRAEQFNSEIKFGQHKDKTIIIRGCDKDIKNFLENEGYSSLYVGKEAILDTGRNPFEKKSLRSLVSRGLRHGKIVRIPFSKIYSEKLEKLKKISVHGQSPYLKNLFEIEFTPNHILNVFADAKSNWLAAIMLSQNSHKKLHTELLLRRNDCPNGVMEALVEYSFNYARNNNYQILSLGEVPFIARNDNKIDFYSWILTKSAKYFRFAYNYAGLFDFKNKFNPEWQNIYICASKKIGYKELYFLFINSNFHNLIIYKFLTTINVKRFIQIITNNRILVPRKLDFNKT